jgi:hypothetical protein
VQRAAITLPPPVLAVLACITVVSVVSDGQRFVVVALAASSEGEHVPLFPGGAGMVALGREVAIADNQEALTHVFQQKHVGSSFSEVIQRIVVPGVVLQEEMPSFSPVQRVRCNPSVGPAVVGGVPIILHLAEESFGIDLIVQGDPVVSVWRLPVLVLRCTVDGFARLARVVLSPSCVGV